MNIQYSPSDGFAWRLITEGSDKSFSSGRLIVSLFYSWEKISIPVARVSGFFSDTGAGSQKRMA